MVVRLRGLPAFRPFWEGQFSLRRGNANYPSYYTILAPDKIASRYENSRNGTLNQKDPQSRVFLIQKK